MTDQLHEEDREPLVDRYYGLMLGFFLLLCALDVPDVTYAAHRARMNEVLRELEVDEELPAEHEAYVANFTSLARDVFAKLKRRSKEVADFFVFGVHSMYLLAGVDDAGVEFGVRRKDFDAVIDRYALDRTAILEVASPGWDAGRIDEPLWTELVGKYYQLAVVALWPLSKQENTWFVIMPFADPFGGRYLSFYREIVTRAGYTPIRAWVGLTNELYLRLLATLISRCGAALADVSAQAGSETPNLNVLHEIGLNMGLENSTFIIRDERPVVLPSNFTGLKITQYDSSVPEFPVAMAAAIVERLRQDQDSG